VRCNGRGTASKKTPRFAKTIAAARALKDAGNAVWEAQWALGDALVNECGPPGEHGVNSRALEKVLKVLREHELDYTLRRLEQFRSIAHKFTDRRRLRSVSFDAHLAAGDTDTLAEAHADAEKNKAKLTVARVKQFIERRRKEDEEKQRREHPKLKGREKSDTARDDAIDAFAREAAKAAESARYAMKRLKPHIGALLANERRELIEAVDRAVAPWTAGKNEIEFELREAAE
jgi:hypothetical protein